MKFTSLAILSFAMLLQSMLCKAQSFSIKDSQDVIALNLKAFEIRTKDPALSLTYARNAVTIAQSISYTRGLSYSYNIYGNYYKVKGLYDSSLHYYKKSLEIRQTLKDTIGIARSYRNIFSVENLLGNDTDAINTAHSALTLLNKTPENPDIKKEKALLKNALGFIYFENGDTKHALIYIHEAKKIFEEEQDENNTASASINLATIFESQKLFAKASTEYKTTIPIFIHNEDMENLARAYNGLGNVNYQTNDYASALSNYRKSLSIKQKYGFTSLVKGAYLNIGIIYETYGKLDSAETYYKLALEEAVLEREKQSEFDGHWNLGTLLFRKGENRSALNHLLSAHHLFIKQPKPTENSILLKDISRVYAAMQLPDSALFYANTYTGITDSLNEQLRRSVEFEGKIQEQDSALKLSVEKARHQTTTITGMLAAIIFLIIIFFLYYQYTLSKRKVEELNSLVKDKELKALDAMLEGQDEERKRLAVELHDTIGSMLSATKLSFKAMEKSLEKMVEENLGQYSKINTMLDATMDSVRRISHNMAAGIFSEKGIEGALTELCQTFQQPGGMRIHLNIHGFDTRLDYTTEVNLYRIVQELLTNIIKHAGAKNVTVQLLKSSNNINLTVEDDGQGFDPNEAKRKKGIGLSNIAFRVKKLAGDLNIDSVKEKGTTVIIDIPIKSTSNYE